MPRGVNGGQDDRSAVDSGAAYVYRFDGSDWVQQAYVKASNPDRGDKFGRALALSVDGDTLVVGAHTEDSNATGIGGDQNDNSIPNAGARTFFDSMARVGHSKPTSRPQILTPAICSVLQSH